MADDPEKPKRGDQVKLCGKHRYAGFTGTYVGETQFMGKTLPIVRVNHPSGKVRTMVLDPERQMRKA